MKLYQNGAVGRFIHVFIRDDIFVYGGNGLNKKALAHIRLNDQATQSLEEHLLAVASLAQTFAGKIGLPLNAAYTGLIHDLGKYASMFQHYLQSANNLIDQDSDDYIDAASNKGKIDHSTAGAQFAYRQLHTDKYALFAQMVFLAICSHHSGLIDCLEGDGEKRFDKRLLKSDEQTHLDECINKIDARVKEALASLPTDKLLKEWYRQIRHIAQLEKQFSSQQKSMADKQADELNTRYIKTGLLLRCFLSCLLDADRIDSASFEDEQYKALRERLQKPDWRELSDRLEGHLSAFSIRNPIDAIRRDIANACLERSVSGQGIYTLTVPTGGGKTLSSLRFAINHAREHGLDRIIYIIPYTSIIEQNARVVREILEQGEEPGTIVLEHHSNIEPSRESWQGKLLSSNWETPIVFTTMVQFLETLFGSGTASARRMHNLCNAVLLFDEIQTLPIRCVHLFCHALNFLSETGGTTSVLCTATQPLLGKVPDPAKGQLRLADDAELMPDLAKLFDSLQRVEFIDHTHTPMDAVQTAALAMAEQAETGNCLVIVNTKSWASQLYRSCQEKGAKNVFHLSTSMCAAHRENILGRVVSLLKEKEPVLLISTQLIECGVDISFASVIRLAAGLDSILQAAGRCNRNMEKKQGRVHIIKTIDGQENISRLEDIREGRNVFLRVLNEYRATLDAGQIDLGDPRIIERYFAYYFYGRKTDMSYPVRWKGKDDTLLNMLGLNRKNTAYNPDNTLLQQSFATAASCFAAIDAETEGIIVPYGEGKNIITQLCSLPVNEKAALARKRQLLKQAQRYTVNLFPDARKKMGKAIKTMEDTGIAYLTPAYYDADTGVTPEATGEMDFLNF